MLTSLVSFAQADKYKDIIKPEGIKNKKYLVTLSGIADVELFKPININLGMSASGSIRLLYKPKLNKSKSVYNPQVIEREIYLKPTFGFVYRKRFNTSLYFIPEIAYRHTLSKGFFVEINFDAGYLYTKLNAPTYEQQHDGTFKKVNFGFHNVLLGGKFSTGYKKKKKLKTPIALNFGTGIYFRYPSNQHWVRHVYVEAGISYVFRKEKE